MILKQQINGVWFFSLRSKQDELLYRSHGFDSEEAMNAFIASLKQSLVDKK